MIRSPVPKLALWPSKHEKSVPPLLGYRCCMQGPRPGLQFPAACLAAWGFRGYLGGLGLLLILSIGSTTECLLEQDEAA